MDADRLEARALPEVPPVDAGPLGHGRLRNRRKGDLRPTGGERGMGWPARARFEDQFTNPRHEPCGPSYDDEDEDAGDRRPKH